MEQILDRPTTNQRTLEYAGFWIRAAALLIDSIVVMIPVAIVLVVLGVMQEPVGMVIAYVIMVFGIIAYIIGMESSAKQGTFGKLAVGIKVGDEQGNRISVGKATGRYFSKILSGLILYVGYMMAGWDPKKQALHDKIAGTVVFYSK